MVATESLLEMMFEHTSEQSEGEIALIFWSKCFPRRVNKYQGLGAARRLVCSRTGKQVCLEQCEIQEKYVKRVPLCCSISLGQLELSFTQLHPSLLAQPDVQ